jgi:hypothetical protein
MTQPPDNNLHDWLDGTVGEAPDPIEGTQQVMSQIEETPQAGRWLPFPLFHRKAKVKTPTTKYQPTPISALNGHTPTVLGRTQSMFSPVKAITAGALVFAIGGAFLIAQPFGQQESIVPGADTEAVPATWVTGTVRYPSTSGCTTDPTSEVDGTVRRERGYVCGLQTWTTSDPRLTGEVAEIWNADVYDPDADVFKAHPTRNVSVITSAYDLRNEAGGWTCHSSQLAHGYGFAPVRETGETAMCVGDGEYDGLSAILVIDRGPKSVVGLIFPGDAPPLPEPPAAE